MQSFKQYLAEVGLEDSAVASLTKPNSSVMLVGSNKIDARIQSKEDLPRATESMKRAVSQILTDESAVVRAIDDDGNFGKEVPWGDVYVLSRKNKPGYIEVEYFEQATRNKIGDTMWLGKYLAQKPTQVLRAGAEKLGLVTSPEKYYLASFIKELDRLANQGILLGWPENWKADTQYIGRNIIIRSL